MARCFEIAVDDRAAALAGDALRGEALRRRRAAERFSGELEADRAAGRVKDIRTGALQVVKLLAEADALESAATAFEEGWAAATDLEDEAPPPDPSTTPAEPTDPPPPNPEDDPDVVAARLLLAEPGPASEAVGSLHIVPPAAP